MKINLLHTDITKIKVDAIVNAANTSLFGGGGVDGAIHRAGGEAILAACRVVRNRQGGCKTGEAVITTAGTLAAKYVIHTVGPVWNDGDKNEAVLLANCYINSLKLADKYKVKTIAFPNISTGIYGFPKELAAKIAIDTVRKHAQVAEVLFVCFDAENYAIYEELLTNKTANVLIGLSLADALGVPVEFNKRAALKKNPVVDMRSFGTYNQPAGTWSDDSSLAFCLADSLRNGYNLMGIAQKFVAWKKALIWTPRGTVFDIGIQTSRAINQLEKIIDVNDLEALKSLKYTGDEYTNGNGSLMRILPLLHYTKDKSTQEQFDIIWEVSALTHPHIRAAIACFIYLKFAEFIANGFALNEAYREMKVIVNSFFKTANFAAEEVQLFDRILKYNIADYTEDDIFSDGYVLHTLEASFWTLLNSQSYLDAVFKAINLGEDTDTTATVVGGIAGMYYGLDDVPNQWVNQLARIEDIRKLGSELEKNK